MTLYRFDEFFLSRWFARIYRAHPGVYQTAKALLQ